MLTSNDMKYLIYLTTWLRGPVCRTTDHAESFHPKVNAKLKGSFRFMHSLKSIIKSINQSVERRKYRYGKSAAAKIRKLRQYPDEQKENGNCDYLMKAYYTKMFGIPLGLSSMSTIYGTRRSVLYR